MRFIRGVLAVMAMMLAAVPAHGVLAQGDGVGFEDLPGLQTTVTRTFSGEAGFDPNAQLDTSLRAFAKPKVLMLMVAIFEFDTEANAATGYELLRNDMNATGIDGAPLPLTEIEAQLPEPNTVAIAEDQRSSPTLDFTVVVALDGTSVLSVISITSGAPAVSDVVSMTRTMASVEAGIGPGTFSADGTSTGEIWDVVPGSGAVERHFRGITSVVDAVAFGG